MFWRPMRQYFQCIVVRFSYTLGTVAYSALTLSFLVATYQFSAKFKTLLIHIQSNLQNFGAISQVMNGHIYKKLLFQCCPLHFSIGLCAVIQKDNFVSMIQRGCIFRDYPC